MFLRDSENKIMSVEKLYVDDNYLIVNKPYDMYINSNDGNEKNTVANHIAKHDSHLSTSSEPLHFVQRLDYATSGVLCIAKNKLSAAKAGRLLEKRLANKYYLAVVRGHVEWRQCCVLYEIGEDPSTADTNHKMVAVTDAATRSSCHRPRSAETRVLVVETGSYDGEPVTVLLLKPTTGRRHQLRAHCASLRHTILGDVTYSEGRDRAPHRMFLHAIRLVLPLPEGTLDIQTAEPFLSDHQFLAKWKPLQRFYHYENKEQFISVCDVIDRLDLKSDDCKEFKSTS